MDKPLYDQARNQLLNMTYADYFYIISYPTYDGYKVEHDPEYTVYLTITPDDPTNPLGPLIGLLVILAVIAIVVVAAVLVLKRRRS
jgi:subtilase family serine protease